MRDLRSFLHEVRQKRPADMVEVPFEVDPHHETAAIVTKLELRGRSPILLFRKVKGSALTLVTNVCGSLGRLAMALECSLPDVGRIYAERVRARIPPRIATEPALCQEVVARGDEVDLGILPRLVYHLDDAAEPYITAAIVVARDPETSKTNLSYHRLMIAGRDRTGILMEKGKHLDGIFQKYAAAGQDMPIAAFVGAHPLWSLGALYSGAPGDEEYDAIGGLLGEPLALTRCITLADLAVPAATELVLEGVVTHAERMREGPFGEFTGYGTGATQTPVFRVQALTHRRDFVFQDIVSGRMEHLVLSMPAIEERTRRIASEAAEGIERVALPAALTVVVAMRKQSDDDPKRVIEALLRSDIYCKHVFVVDADVDPGDLRAVLGAMALHTQADRNVEILRDELGTPLDPSCPNADGRSAKMGIDATRPLQPSRAATRNRLPPELLDAIDLEALLRKK